MENHITYATKANQPINHIDYFQQLTSGHARVVRTPTYVRGNDQRTQ